MNSCAVGNLSRSFRLGKKVPFSRFRRMGQGATSGEEELAAARELCELFERPRGAGALNVLMVPAAAYPGHVELAMAASNVPVFRRVAGHMAASWPATRCRRFHRAFMAGSPRGHSVAGHMASSSRPATHDRALIQYQIQTSWKHQIRRSWIH